MKVQVPQHNIHNYTLILEDVVVLLTTPVVCDTPLERCTLKDWLLLIIFKSVWIHQIILKPQNKN